MEVDVPSQMNQVVSGVLPFDLVLTENVNWLLIYDSIRALYTDRSSSFYYKQRR